MLEWSTNGKPEVTNTATRAVPVAELAKMQNSISDLYQLVAIERLRNDANVTDPTSKLGILLTRSWTTISVIPAKAQTAAILPGELTLPIAAAVQDPPQVRRQPGRWTMIWFLFWSKWPPRGK